MSISWSRKPQAKAADMTAAIRLGVDIAGKLLRPCLFFFRRVEFMKQNRRVCFGLIEQALLGLTPKQSQQDITVLLAFVLPQARLKWNLAAKFG